MRTPITRPARCKAFRGFSLPSSVLCTTTILLLLLLAHGNVYADSATWKANPSSGDWNTAANWMPATVPNGRSDTVTFATYECVLNRSTLTASQIQSSFGVTISSNVPFRFVDTGSDTLTAGTVFTVIHQLSAGTIAGTFSNLAEGATFTSNGTTFKASYTGGNGNDLTLTVR